MLCHAKVAPASSEMKIGVISDTHLSKPNPALYRLTEGIFADVSIVLHAGDLTRLAILEAFSSKEVIAVSGNMDRHDVTAKFPPKEIITIAGYSIGLIHGWGSPWGIEDKIIYGHTHKPANHIRDGVLMFNPGSFSGSFLLGRNPSVGILTVDDGVRGKIINL